MSKSLFNLADDNDQFWPDFTYNGQEYDFNHLTSCKHTFQHPDRNEHYTLFFTFSHHVFTKAQDSQSTPEQIYNASKTDLRSFDVDRYNLSKHLPLIVETLPSQYCYHGGYSRYCSCEIQSTDGDKIYYQVVYRAWKERGKIRFHIESAYPLETKLGRVKKVNFWVICHNLLKGKKPPTPAN